MTESDATVVLSLAHSPDPDDAFMWWPITGKVVPPENPADVSKPARVLQPPVLDTGRFTFRAFPADIEVLNRSASGATTSSENRFDITALSVRTWADIADRYAVTACGASFGDGYGPKLVARMTDAAVLCEQCLNRPGQVIAIPGRGTTAFMMLQLLLRDLLERGIGTAPPQFAEMRFDRIMPAVANGEADVGLLIHEGQISHGETGLCTIADVGVWWKQRTGLKLPLGVNAVRRDLDSRFGPGTCVEIGDLLRRCVQFSMERWDESVQYALKFAEANANRSQSMGGRGESARATLDRVDQYCRMYVTPETLDMGSEGREAIERLLAEGAAAGLCPSVGQIDLL